jgi:hypothetical protein
MKEGLRKVDEAAAGIGKNVNGWRVGSAFGDSAFCHCDWLLLAAAAKAGIYGNDAIEATYPATRHDSDGERSTARSMPTRRPSPRATCRGSVRRQDAAPDQEPDRPASDQLADAAEPDAKHRRVAHALHPEQVAGPENEANWLSAPDGPIYLVTRLYRPKTEPPSMLPAGEGTWKPPGLTRAS